MSHPLASKHARSKAVFGEPALWRKLRVSGYMWFRQTETAVERIGSQLREPSPNLQGREVRFLIQNQAFQEARDYLERELGTGRALKQQAELQYLLARCYLGQGLIAEAKEQVEQALGGQPHNAEFWEVLADCLLEQGEWQEAIAALDKALRVAPTRAAILYRMGSIYARQGEYVEALRCFSGCCQLLPRNAVYWEMKAETHLHLNQMPEACDSFEKSLRYSINLEVATRLAYCYVQLGNVKKGIRYYKIILKHETDNYDALCNLAAVYQNQGKSLEALNLLERAHSNYPNDPILANNLAYVLVQLGRTRKAIEQYHAALRLAPANPLILYNLSICLVRRGNWEEAMDTLNNLLEIEPDNSAAWALLGNIYEQWKQYEIAIDCFNRALHLSGQAAK